jgi:lysyl-tRNA synthetase class 2
LAKTVDNEAWKKFTHAHSAGAKIAWAFETFIEPMLRRDRPSFVIDFPIEVSPLARRRDSEPRLVDRFEAYAGGMEIANAFSELNDPRDQESRFRAQVEAAAKGDVEAMPYDRDFIRALEHGMPPTAGEGLGIDRLAMLFTDAASIRDVILFPLLKPEEGGQ